MADSGRARQGNHAPTDRDSQRTRADENAEHVIGYIGEEAWSYISGLEVDTALRQGGDNLVDFRFGTKTIDVKARSEDWHAMLIKVDQLLVEGHCYVHCWVDVEARSVRFWGWVAGNEVARFPVRPARNVSLPYENYEIEPHEGRNIGKLLSFIDRFR